MTFEEILKLTDYGIHRVEPSWVGVERDELNDPCARRVQTNLLSVVWGSKRQCSRESDPYSKKEELIDPGKLMEGQNPEGTAIGGLAR